MSDSFDPLALAGSPGAEPAAPTPPLEPAAALRAELALCMGRDRARLGRRLRRLRRPVAGAALARVRDAVAASRAERERRIAGLPRPEVAPDLPIAAHAGAIEAAIRAHQVVIVAGETGSGKTTQLPKICLRAGRGVDGQIGHTQPRRVAARSVAARLAQEMGARVRGAVGCKVRFSDETGPDGFVKLMTDGILLAEIHGDRRLDAYDTIIVDEAHERSLDIDFLLGYLKTLLRRRPELRVVVSSATLDIERFARFFGGAPVIEVSGRSYPIEVRYRPPVADGPVEVADAVAEAVDELCAEGPGDILVFLSGEREIRDTAGVLRKRSRALEILPLYARLPLGQQERLFAPHRSRRVVLATNVAETSLTVPGIRFVVDTGLARIGRFSPRSSVQRLPIEPISRASAEQRKGRCGRLGPGVCVRLYAEEDLAARPEHTAPEIVRTDLASVVLRLEALGAGNTNTFPFLDPPDRRHLNDGMRLLRELGALDEHGGLTQVGERLARLAVDPRIGRMLIAADELDSLADVLVIAAAMTIPDPRERPEGAAPAAAAAHARFRHERSDFLSQLNLWDFYRSRTRGASGAEIRRLCRRHFLSPSRMREWRDVHDQLRAQCAELGLHRGRRGSGYGRVHKALVAGLWRLVGSRTEEREYRGVRGATFRLSPASGQYDVRPRWVVAAELVETQHAYAHCVASVRPEWIERAARAQLRRGHFEAHWDARRGEVMAFEQTAVYELVLTPRRRVRYAPVSRAGAREVFIRSALVEGELGVAVAALEDNAAVVAALREQEARLRRPGAILDDRALFAFYDAVLPAEVCDVRGFQAWRRRAEANDPDCLRVAAPRLRRPHAPTPAAEDYPDNFRAGGETIPLRYRFAPGEQRDGVTALVPVAALRRLRAADLDAAVPGLLPEKVSSLMRGLPKDTRRALTPIGPHVGAFLSSRMHSGASLLDALGHYLRAATGVTIERQAWRPERLEAHLRLHLRVVGEDGQALAEGDDLAELQQRLRKVPGAAARARRGPAERFGLKEWTFGDLPEQVESERDGRVVVLYPALLDQEDSVALCMVDAPALAAAEHVRGVRRLFALAAPRELAALRRAMPDRERLSLLYSLVPAPVPWCGAAGAARGAWGELVEALLEIVVVRALGEEAERTRTRAEFETLRAAALGRLEREARAVCTLVGEILEAHRRVRELRLEPGLHAPAASLADVDRQLALLVGRRFLSRTPVTCLESLPRYLAAIERRLEKLAAGGARDGARVSALEPFWSRFERRAAEHAARGLADPALDRFRWLLEEYRVSLFAQEMGTAEPVSEKRLERAWVEVEP
jgi:ATP-dependent helicase HrpA